MLKFIEKHQTLEREERAKECEARKHETETKKAEAQKRQELELAGVQSRHETEIQRLDMDPEICIEVSLALSILS